mgnify:CR=1 FL=1
MRYDLSPLYRATVGFDRLAALLDSAGRGDEQVSYPPYNIEKLGEDNYRISMAVAGFGEGELEIIVKESSLLVSGKKTKTEETGNGNGRGTRNNPPQMPVTRLLMPSTSKAARPTRCCR